MRERLRGAYLPHPRPAPRHLLFYRAPEGGQIFSLEHNYLVTEDGWEQLEKTPQHLLEVD